MSLEKVDFIPDLDENNPTPTDFRSQGDDHIRNIKRALVKTFAGFIGEEVVSTEEQLNALRDWPAGTTVFDYVDALLGNDEFGGLIPGLSRMIFHNDYIAPWTDAWELADATDLTTRMVVIDNSVDVGVSEDFPEGENWDDSPIAWSPNVTYNGGGNLLAAGTIRAPQFETGLTSSTFRPRFKNFKVFQRREVTA